jgi:fumarylacetoacetate (FAA) hydrolase
MKLATIRSQDPKKRSGDLVVICRDHVGGDRYWAVRATRIAPSLLEALESWKEAEPALRQIADDLAEKGDGAAGAFRLNLADCLAPLPRAPGFYDGSAFLSHVFRARKARGDEMPPSAKMTPLMYQGVSDNLLPWNAPIDLMDPSFGGDFEGEFAVIVTDVPKGTPAERMAQHIALLTMFNDITYREVVKSEIENKFGFLQSKPNNAFAPFVVTPDEMGPRWRDGRLDAELKVTLNTERFGEPNGREMHFSFTQLVAHACRTRPLAAGSIIGSGTVSNEDKGRGFACLTEKRFQEVLDDGRATTPWLKPGDRVTFDCIVDGVSVFGPIDEMAVL